ncbi:MAG TPA: sigma-70 family RNA polymerase sigma factor [Ktedonobacterales bacterium]|jgi:RNA polymerase sigma-70 factor (ECF subfamily)|nr:sigma-70 family RNA polymerase sigma factor [Ktedonobacterales bacterium]
MRERATSTDAPGSATPAAPAPLSLAAFSAVVDQWQAALFGFLQGMLGDAEQARDLTQDTFHNAWRATQALAPPWSSAYDDDERRRWLFHAAYCRAISHMRRRKVIRWASLDWAGVALREDDGFDTSFDDVGALTVAGSFEQRVVEAEALRAALARLRPDDAACLLLRVTQGFSAAEVAAMLGITTDAVGQRLSRARRRLRAVYLAQNPPDDADVGRSVGTERSADDE